MPKSPSPFPPSPLILPTQEYQCPRGHKWNGTGLLQFGIPINGHTQVSTKPLCPHCLVAFLDEHFGDVAVVEPAPTSDSPQPHDPQKDA